MKKTEYFQTKYIQFNAGKWYMEKTQTQDPPQDLKTITHTKTVPKQAQKFRKREISRQLSRQISLTDTCVKV